MTYMEVNPDWTVPPGIIRRDYLPKLQANPGALRHLEVIDRRGRVVPRGSVDFASYSASKLSPSTAPAAGGRQRAGAGQVHVPQPACDLSARHAGKASVRARNRAYSSGCVRLNDPFDFAYELLSRQEADPKAAFHKVLDSGGRNASSSRNPCRSIWSTAPPSRIRKATCSTAATCMVATR
jgi:L,D-transpeptidase YcbB